MSETNVERNATALSKSDVATNVAGFKINFLNPEQLAAAENYLKRAITTEKSGIKSINEGLAVMMRANDLDLPFTSCCEHIHVINGKTGIDIHIIKTLLRRAGVIWECVKDYTPLYEYTDGSNVYMEDKIPDFCIKCKDRKDADDKRKADNNEDIVYVYPVRFYADYNGNIYRDYQLDGRFAIASNKTDAANVAKTGKCPIYRIPAQPIDYVTEYKFTRYLKINGKERETTSVGRFSYSDAVTAGLVTKDIYVKYGKIMVGNRAFTYGARDIASDALMGCYETSELKIINGAPLTDDDFVSVEEIN